ncbi:DUF300-domain-containing protein [Panus rudis PR-1116 ss-1]|nr:DUF300-domain-containing protein [Panus rudis PR-1116 ss-1]
MADIENGRCHAKKAPQDGPPLIQHGDLVFQAHHVGWIITGFFTIVAIMTSFWLINKHLQWYTNKREQRYIVRILFMVPIYAVISFASYLFWNHSTPLLLLRDCYESTVLTSFFYLLLLYLSPDPVEQQEIFRKSGLSRENDKEARKKGQKLHRWVFPLGFIKWKPVDGLFFLQLIKWGVLQYCVVRPLTTLIAVILDYAGLYCEDSWSPGWGHIYITVVVSLSVTIAMYCLIQLYVCVSDRLKPQKPLLKLFAIKAVVFLTFWQATVLSFFTILGWVKDTTYMTADNINIGLGAILETFEMMLFAFLHIKAFTYKLYRMPPDRTPRWRALIHAMNFKETLRELWAGTRYMVRRARGRETDIQARREAALEDVFGRTRFEIAHGSRVASEKDELNEKSKKGNKGDAESRTLRDLAIAVETEELVHVGAERQWLGLGDGHAYSLGYQSRREKSEGLEAEIEKELAKRGLGRRERSENRSHHSYERLDGEDKNQVQGHSKKPSWWRNIYNRLSQSGQEPQFDSEKMISHRRSSRVERSLGHIEDHAYDDPPPASAIKTYRDSKRSRKPQSPPAARHPTMPLPQYDIDLENTVPYAQPATSGLGYLTPHAYAPPMATTPSATSLSVSDRPDSFLARAFPYTSDASHSGETILSDPPSSQSHQSRVRLGGTKDVVVTSTVYCNRPVMAETPNVVGFERAVVEDTRATLERLVEEPDIEAPPPPPKTKSVHRRDFAQHAMATSIPAVSSQYTNRHMSPPFSRPDRSNSPKRKPVDYDRLVMPAPLAPQNHQITQPPSVPNVVQPTLLERGRTLRTPQSPSTTTSPTRSPQHVSPTAPYFLRRPVHPPAHVDSLQSGDNSITPPPKLRRATQNIKRHSYDAEGRARARAERRVSAPIPIGEQPWHPQQYPQPKPSYDYSHSYAPR